MFEVEIKFLLNNAEKTRLLEGALYVSEQHFTDVYYDNQEYNLSTNDIWLRTRNDKFILKLPISTNNASLKKQHNTPKLEIEDVHDILKHLKIRPAKDIY